MSRFQASISSKTNNASSCSAANSATSTPESFVDVEKAAAFLSLTRRRLLDLVRIGQLPGHPLGIGSRKTWRFRLSELAAAVQASLNCNRQFPAPMEGEI